MPSTGREPEKSWLLPMSIAGAALLALGGFWSIGSVLRSRHPVRMFESAALGCRFEYPSALTSGPNFVRDSTGSLLTIERHSLSGAASDFVAGLPDVLFPQVRIQLDQGYRDLAEVSRSPVTLGGRRGLEVTLTGHPGRSSVVTVITVDIVATRDWVYVLRAYAPEALHGKERLFDRVRGTLRFLSGGEEASPP